MKEDNLLYSALKGLIEYYESIPGTQWSKPKELVNAKQALAQYDAMQGEDWPSDNDIKVESESLNGFRRQVYTDASKFDYICGFKAALKWIKDNYRKSPKPSTIQGGEMKELREDIQKVQELLIDMDRGNYKEKSTNAFVYLKDMLLKTVKSPQQAGEENWWTSHAKEAVDQRAELQRIVIDKQQAEIEQLKQGHGNWSASDVENFMIWKDENRWFNFDKPSGKWKYTFEEGTAMGKKTYEKNYMKTTEELFTEYQKQSIESSR